MSRYTKVKIMKRAIPALGLIMAMAGITGCASTGTQGVRSIGPDLYMIGGLGNFTDFSGSSVKIRYFEEANAYCTSKNMIMVPVNSSGQDSGFGTYASAEVIFNCFLPNDPRLNKNK